jgi:hypothetical protein
VVDDQVQHGPNRLPGAMITGPKQAHPGARLRREQPRHASRDTAEIRERALAVLAAASREDLVEQWKGHALRGIERRPRRHGAHGIATLLGFGLLAEWSRGIWRAHDAALGIERLIPKAEALLQAGDPTGAARIAQSALAHTLLSEHRTRLWLTTAWAGIAQRDPFLTHTALQQLPAAALTLDLVAAYLTTCNRVEEACDLLAEARKAGYRSRACSKQWIDLLVMRGSMQEAARLAAEDADLLSDRDIEALASAGLAVSPRQAKP